MLARQEDFLRQKSGIEEEFDKYNREHGTRHICIFLPKFHPELNFIERIWGRSKYHIRRHCDQTFAALDKNLTESLQLPNLTIDLIRRYARTVYAYLHAYEKKLDLVQAHAFIKRHRSHRFYGRKMDASLHRLYYPFDEPYEEVEADVREELLEIQDPEGDAAVEPDTPEVDVTLASDDEGEDGGSSVGSLYYTSDEAEDSEGEEKQ